MKTKNLLSAFFLLFSVGVSAQDSRGVPTTAVQAVDKQAFVWDDATDTWIPAQVDSALIPAKSLGFSDLYGGGWTAGFVPTVQSDGTVVPELVAVQSASNGVSMNGTAVELGNAVGGTIGQLTSPREIPLNSQSLLISGPTLRNWKFDVDGLYSAVDNTKSYGIGYQLGLANTGASFSGGAGYGLGYQNTGANFSGGAGLLLGYQNTGANFSGGSGYSLGYQNTGANFSGGAGLLLGYQNTGADFSGGAGYQLGYLNTGASFSGGAGYSLGQQNTGANFSGGAGILLGFQNTGDNFSGGAGLQLGYQNTGASFSGGAGYSLGQQNTGANFSGGAGYLLGYQNTGASFSGGAGYQLGYQNTGSNFSGGAGYALGQQNTGASFSAGAGYALGYLNTGDDFVGLGANTGEYNRGNNSVFIGANSGTPFVLTTGTILAADITAGVISGTSAASIIADLSGVNGQYYPVGISNYSAYQLKVVGATLTGGPSSIAANETYTTYQKIDNVAVFGNNVDYTKANQVNIGNSDQTEIRFAEEYAFDVSAALGAGDDGKVFSYDSGTGQFELTSPNGISLAAVGSAPNANGATISGLTLNLQPASASFPGVVTAADYTKIQNSIQQGGNTFAAQMVIGTTDANSIGLNTFNVERMNISAAGQVQFNNYTSAASVTGTTNHFITQAVTGKIITKTAAEMTSELGAWSTSGNTLTSTASFGSNTNSGFGFNFLGNNVIRGGMTAVGNFSFGQQGGTNARVTVATGGADALNVMLKAGGANGDSIQLGVRNNSPVGLLAAEKGSMIFDGANAKAYINSDGATAYKEVRTRDIIQLQSVPSQNVVNPGAITTLDDVYWDVPADMVGRNLVGATVGWSNNTLTAGTADFNIRVHTRSTNTVVGSVDIPDFTASATDLFRESSATSITLAAGQRIKLSAAGTGATGSFSNPQVQLIIE